MVAYDIVHPLSVKNCTLMHNDVNMLLLLRHSFQGKLQKLKQDLFTLKATYSGDLISKHLNE